MSVALLSGAAMIRQREREKLLVTLGYEFKAKHCPASIRYFWISPRLHNKTYWFFGHSRRHKEALETGEYRSYIIEEGAQKEAQAAKMMEAINTLGYKEYERSYHPPFSVQKLYHKNTQEEFIDYSSFTTESELREFALRQDELFTRLKQLDKNLC